MVYIRLYILNAGNDALKSARSNDDVVDELDAEHRSCVKKLAGDRDVVIARGKVSRRVVVDKNDGCRVVFEGGTENFPWMDDVGIDGPDRDRLVVDHLVVAVEIDSSEVLFWEIPHVLRVFVHVLRGPDDLRARGVPFEHSAAQLDRRDHLHRLDDRDVEILGKFFRIGFRRDASLAVLLKDAGAHRKDVFFLCPVSKDDGPQFGYGKQAGSFAEKLFPGFFLVGNIPYLQSVRGKERIGNDGHVS